MLPGVSPSSGDSATASPPLADPSTTAPPASDLGTSGFSEDERGRTDDGTRNSGGNRWPRQETLYLLKIRSDMDAAFRDSSLKAPLWDEVSRKLASLGFHRSAKKCKEKFENVYKYHKRIKDGRSSKSDGKTYKFFEQLEALEASPAAGGNHQPLPPPPPVVPMPSVVTPISTSELQQNNVDPISVAAPAAAVNVDRRVPFSFPQMNVSASDSISLSESSSEEDEPVEKRRNRKRKWKEFFGRLMKEVVEKQEELQSKFLDALERRERDRVAREEAWRLQEMAKMKREHELLVQERSMVAAKDAAVITFLQKITEQNPTAVVPQVPPMQLLQQQQTVPMVTPPPQPQPQPQPQQQTPPSVAAPVPLPVPVPVPAPAPPLTVVKNLETATGDNMLQPSPSRWPKAEIDALIQIRTSLDAKYQDSGPKGPLWEEVSAMMRNLGYNRNAKRCKEKWENINKYYKKVKESSKKRPEDSKTCPYFHQLDAIYREKALSTGYSNSNIGLAVKPETQMAPIMARPEQQWPLPTTVQQQQQQQLLYQQKQQQQQQQQQNADLNEDEYDDDEDDDEEEEEEEGGEYEIVPNKTSSMASAE